jgi:hypothetical protein
LRPPLMSSVRRRTEGKRNAEPRCADRHPSATLHRLDIKPGRFRIVPAVDDEKTIYLVPTFEDDVEAERVLNLVYADVFERELFGWHTDDSAWPKRRTLTMFKEWFKIEMHSMVEDLCSDELTDDDV